MSEDVSDYLARKEAEASEDLSVHSTNEEIRRVEKQIRDLQNHLRWLRERQSRTERIQELREVLAGPMETKDGRPIGDIAWQAMAEELFYLEEEEHEQRG